ncbi:hypothetical protein Y032_0067g98 [Ancylostoma ceylanicum]|uniref:Uncharacterized protein n=1 Tax=Ancylostoma ceylanicum TaxID=53326 RepID=A0A016U100_9BILA|nr:hypothetical protein Y032_0067g98 [Ancylostoma ceylanicum]
MPLLPLDFMNEGSSRGIAAYPQVNCLFVCAEVCDQGTFHKRERPITSSERRKNDAATNRAIAMVYNNDLLMRHIISFVTNMNDRVNVELSSSRLRMISRTAMWRFRSGGHTLSLTYKTFNDYVSVEVGDVWLVLPSTTMESRMVGTTRRLTQPAKLMKTLYGMAERFALEIQHVKLGGVDTESRNRGVQNHQLIVTADLLRLINDRFKNLRTISFRHCGFDELAIKYLTSKSCSLSARINELALDSIWFDSTSLIRGFTSLLSSFLRVLKLENFSIIYLGVELLGRIRELGIVLDDLHLRLTTSTMHGLTMQDIRSFLEDASSAARELRIDVLCSHSRRGDRFFLALRILPNIANISELQLFVEPVNRRDIEDLTHILNNLGKLPFLRKFSCGDWRNSGLSAALHNGLLDCSSLREVVLSNIIECNPNEMVMLLSAIPRQVQSLSLKHLPITDMELVKWLSSLRELKLVKLPKVSSRGIFQALSLLRHLEVFYCSIPTSALLLRSILISRSLKQLQKITMVITTGSPSYYEELMSEYFFNVCCTKYRSKPIWCHVEAEGRFCRT